MKILDRYLSGQILSTVVWAVGLLTMILVLGNVLRDLLGLLLSHQVPVTYILTFIGYLLPFSLIYSIPWGVLVAVLLVFGNCLPIMNWLRFGRTASECRESVLRYLLSQSCFWVSVSGSISMLRRSLK